MQQEVELTIRSNIFAPIRDLLTGVMEGGEPRSGRWPDEVIPHSIAPGFFLNWPCIEADVSCSLAI